MYDPMSTREHTNVHTDLGGENPNGLQIDDSIRVTTVPRGSSINDRSMTGARSRSRPGEAKHDQQDNRRSLFFQFEGTAAAWSNGPRLGQCMAMGKVQFIFLDK